MAFGGEPDWNDFERDDLAKFFMEAARFDDDGYLDLDDRFNEIVVDGNGEPAVNPMFWAYRVMIWDPVRKMYVSPQETGQKPVGAGGVTRERGIGRRMHSGDGGVRYMEGHMDEEGGYEPGGGVYDTLTDEEAVGVDDFGDMDAMDFEAALGGGSVGGEFPSAHDVPDRGIYTLDMTSPDKERRVLVSGAPHVGLSVIGYPHAMYSIFGDNDKYFFGMHGVDHAPKGAKGGVRRRVTDALRRIWKDKKKGRVLEGDASPVNKWIMDTFFSEGSPLWTQAFTDKDREMFKGVKDSGSWHELLDAMDRMDAADAEEEGDDGKAMLAEYMKPNSRITQAILAHNNALESGDHGFRDFMHDKVVESIMRTLMKYTKGEAETDAVAHPAGNVRLLQVFTPLRAVYGGGDPYDNLYPVSDVYSGRTSAQRDYMNEYLVDWMKLGDNPEIGTAEELIGSESSPIRKYWLMRLKGIPGNVAWNKALGKRFGDIRYLISDDEMKRVNEGIAYGVDPLLRQRMITRGIMRGPGNG